MKTVYIPAGATYNYETLVTDDVIVHGHLHVTNGLKAKHISGRGFITAGEVSADIVDVTELECGTVICRRLLAQRVSVNEAMISESAAVSRFFSANFVKAPSLTVAVSEIGEVDADEIVHLTPKPRGMLLTLLFSKLRTFWLRLTASRPQGRFEKPRTEAEEPSDTPEDMEFEGVLLMEKELEQYVLSLLADYPETSKKIELLRYELHSSVGIFPQEMIEVMSFSKRDPTAASEYPHNVPEIALCYKDAAKQLNCEAFESILGAYLSLIQERDRLHHHIGLLEARQSEIIQEYYFSQHSWNEVATNMGISLRTAYAVRQQAVDALVKMYEFTGAAYGSKRNQTIP